jgi:hypothetical protein
LGKNFNSLKIGPNFKSNIIFNFVKFVTTKKKYDFFSPLSFVRSGMGKNQDPGSGINIPDPPHCISRYRTRKGYVEDNNDKAQHVLGPVVQEGGKQPTDSNRQCCGSGSIRTR